ncbi:prepilin-type N-terminal cleavage/methylation domain-containing protein [Uliginosibacterium sp. H1]|uniref:prepilin-type N-terminal cleavage/methylation domain-containing protein n=1 Tax=Uliginosibacterium sp. H1 TaxID=3114757 RepID=UPI002E190AD8|nr:prepilin-type N-terminal cleavage/methylation domain-containing protein [Uliginosibacterium sp. H1]
MERSTMKSHKRRATSRKQQGVSLVEVLVAVVVFALGMLGQAAFMLTAMQNGQQSRYRVIASYYAEELISAALADTGNRAKYAVTNSVCVDASWAACTDWVTRVQRDLPAQSGSSITVTVTAGVMDVSIPWKGMPGASTGETPIYKTRSDLNLIGS